MAKAKNTKPKPTGYKGDGIDHVNGTTEQTEMPDDFLLTDEQKAGRADAIEGEITDLKALTTTTEQAQGVVLIGGITTEALQAGLNTQTEQRKIIKDFVKQHLEDGVDFGRIHVMSRDKCPDQYNCKKDYHYSKPVLFKPGQEKLFSLFQITGKLERDEETYKMLPNLTGLVAYKCVMYRGETYVGEGRGSATVGEKQRDANATIKIAEKRARMDACLSLGFSEFFAQDLDDPDYKSQAEMANQQAAARAERRDKDEFGLFPRDPKADIDSKEREILFRMMMKYGIDKYYVVDALKLNGIKEPAKMTSGQARQLMGLIKTETFKKPKQPEIAKAPPEDLPVIDIEQDEVIDPDELDITSLPEATPKPTVIEPEIVVDEELKGNVSNLIEGLGLNPSGMMWVKKMVSGKPFGNDTDWTDDQWRTAYRLYEGIQNGSVTVEDRYVAGYIKDMPNVAPPVDPNARIESSAGKEDHLANASAVFPGAKVVKS